MQGIGSVLRDGRVLAKVTYKIKVEQNRIQSTTLEKRESVEDSPTATGSLSVTEGAFDLESVDDWQLELQDGRKVECVRRKGSSNAGSRVHYFEVSGWDN